MNLAAEHYPIDRGGVVENLYFDATLTPVPWKAGTIGGPVSILAT